MATLKTLDLPHLLVFLICLVLLALNAVLAGLLLKELRHKTPTATRGATLRLLLWVEGLAITSLSLYVLEDVLDLGEPGNGLLKAGYLVGLFVTPFFLMRISNRIFQVESRKTREALALGITAALLGVYFALREQAALEWLVAIPGVIVVGLILHNLVYRALRLRRKIPRTRPVARVGTVLIAVSGLFFFSFLLLSALYEIVRVAGARVFAFKLGAFLVYVALTGTIYLGYYMPGWFKRRLALGLDPEHSRQEESP